MTSCLVRVQQSRYSRAFINICLANTREALVHVPGLKTLEL